MRILVVARWQEETSWLPVPGWDTMVVQKEVDLPNEGREPASFFWAMAELRPAAKPGDVFAFVQGNPHDHCDNLEDRLTQPITGYVPLGSTDYESMADGSPHHHGLPVKDRYCEWLQRPWPGKVRFCAGGQFAIPGRLLLQNPESVYGWFMRSVCEGENPWVMERLWEPFWSAPIPG